MPELRIALLFIVLAIQVQGFAGASTQTGSVNMANETLKKRLDDLIDKKTAVTELAGLQMVLLKRGEIVFSHAKGFAHIDDTANMTALTIQHKVRVASISKFVVALGVMRLVESGKLDLDEDISTYLGFELRNPYFPRVPITSRQLLSHTSSIRDEGVYFLAFGEDFRDFFRPSQHYGNGAHFASGEGKQPGAFFTYTNLNFGILAGIVERLTRMRFDQYMDIELFQPLGLDISFNSCKFSNANHDYIATLYRRGMGGEIWSPEDPWQAQVDDNERHCYYGGPAVSSATDHELPELEDYEPGSNPTLFSPQGGLRASALDLGQLLTMLLKPENLKSKRQRVLSRQTVQKMLIPQWQYDDTRGNGNTAGEADINDPSSQNLQTAYGLSTHIVNLKDWGLSEADNILYGHMASAYGLLGQMWLKPETDEGIVILLTGMGNDPALVPSTTPMYGIEEQLLKIALEALPAL